MRKLLLRTIRAESLAGVVLNGSHGQEDADDGKDNTKAGIAQSQRVQRAPLRPRHRAASATAASQSGVLRVVQGVWHHSSLPIKIEIVGTRVERKSWLPVPVLMGTTLPVAKGHVVISSLMNLPLRTRPNFQSDDNVLPRTSKAHRR